MIIKIIVHFVVDCKIVSFLAGLSSYKHRLLSDSNWILYCNLCVVSCLSGVCQETVRGEKTYRLLTII